MRGRNTRADRPKQPAGDADVNGGECFDDEDAAATRAQRDLHERVRVLSVREREELARRGTLPERIAVEQAFGTLLREMLLHNPQLTVVEVARIAKNGTLSNHLSAHVFWQRKHVLPRRSSRGGDEAPQTVAPSAAAFSIRLR